MKWAEAANAAGDVFPVWGTCLGHQLLQILATNASFEELLVETDAVVRNGTSCQRSFESSSIPYPPAPPCLLGRDQALRHQLLRILATKLSALISRDPLALHILHSPCALTASAPVFEPSWWDRHWHVMLFSSTSVSARS